MRPFLRDCVRYGALSVLAVLAPGILIGCSDAISGAPPTVEVPPEVRPAGDYALLIPSGDAVSVTWVGLSGVDPIPSAVLRDPRTLLVPVRGLKPGRYTFAGVASSKDGDQLRRDTVVVVGAPAPPVDPPKPPPVDPPAPAGGLYLLIVRPDGPASPEFTRTMGLPGWDTIRRAGHSVKDHGLTAACQLGACLPPGTALPVVFVLRPSADGRTSMIVRGPVALPTTDAGIADLVEGLK